MIDTRVLGKSFTPLGSDLDKNLRRSFKFIWRNYVGAVDLALLTCLTQVEQQAAATPLANISAEAQKGSM